ncbi:unnamed protein product, partial [Polarella glacialis]
KNQPQAGTSTGSKQTRSAAVGPSITVMSESEKRNAKQNQKKKALSKEGKADGQSIQLVALQLLASIGTDPDDPE